MAARFPAISRAVDPPETHMNYSFGYLIVCTKRELAPGELSRPHAVAIDSNNNQIYVTDINIDRVAIFSETGEFLRTFSHPHMKWSYGIAIYRDNVYVTDIVEHSIFHFKVEADFPLVARIGSLGSGIRQFNEPRQLAVSRYRNLFVCDYKNNRLKILDNRFRFLQHISHHSLTKPIDIKLTQDEIFVLCETSPCIKVFSYPGDLKRSLITRGGIRMQVLNPSFFCLDADCNLLICDFGSHQIKIFSKGGTLLHTLGKDDNEAENFIYPQGITFTSNRKLVIVSEIKKYCLRIFF